MAQPISSVSVTTANENPLNYTAYALTALYDVLHGNDTAYIFVKSDNTTIELLIDKTAAARVIRIADQTLDKTSKDACKRFLQNKDLIIARDPKTNTPYSIGSLMKPPSKSVNFGIVAEVILQCAITARLVERTGSVAANDVAQYLRDYLKSTVPWKERSSKSTLECRMLRYQAKNEKIPGNDIVVSYMATDTRVFKYLQQRAKSRRIELDALLAPFFRDAVRYVNSGAPAEHARYFYTNGLIDKLEIEAVGVFGQIGPVKTKADIRTSYREGYDPRNPNSGTRHDFSLNLSIKSRGEPQFGQATGAYAEAMERFASAVGVTLTEATTNTVRKLVPTTLKGSKITPTADQSEIAQVFPRVQEVVYTDMYRQLNGQRGARAVIRFFNGIEYFMAYRDKSIVVVDIGSGDKTYFVSRFRDLKRRFAQSTITCDLITKDSGNYKFRVFIDGGHVVTLQSRVIGNTCRNYVESGSDLRKWLSEVR
jgi:hypothetical protein